MQMNQHAETFLAEAHELLGELESSLLELENEPGNAELIDRVFRAMHTIKGSGAMFGFEEVSAFTHEIETVFDHVRAGRIEVTKELINLALIARDHIARMLDPAREADISDRSRTIVDAWKQFSCAAEDKAQNAPAPEPVPDKPEEETEVSYWIRFRPSLDIFLGGTNPVRLMEELQELGECKPTAHLDAVPPLDTLDPEKCYVYWDIVLTTWQKTNAIQDIFIFVEDESEIQITRIDDVELAADEVSGKKLGTILVDRGDISQAELSDVLVKQKRIGELLVDEGIVDSSKVQAALAEQTRAASLRKERRKSESSSSIRVASSKLDGLVDLVGELVTVQSRLSQVAGGLGDPELLSISEEVERLTSDLRDNAMSIRMLPIGTTFGTFKRLVRDLAGELGKDVEIETEGGETELDKTVIERLNDPLVHLIRNSIDHGIETPEVRKSAGKPTTGRVKLSALHSGASVLIQIDDDGHGLDPEALRARGVQRNLISPDDELSEQELFSLIFRPGFSTSSEVTNVSGRGVGMDVVKRAIEALRGSIEVSSTHGQGTSIILKLPLTLAIIEGLLVKAHHDTFIMPLVAVEECVELGRDAIEKANGRKVANVRGTIVPYIHLREHFAMGGQPPIFEQIVIANVAGKRVGFAVDEVIGEHQTVIKSLGELYRDVKGISGATILGDGSVALILDLPHLVAEATDEEGLLIKGGESKQSILQESTAVI